MKRKTLIVIIASTLIVLTPLLFLGNITIFEVEASKSFSSRGNTLYVGGSGPNNYTKIQDAIDNASNGDTIYVYNGTYFENVIINKRINLIGEDKSTTIIDASHIGTTVSISVNYVNISGFTIEDSNWETIIINSNYCNISGNRIRYSSSHGIKISSSYHHNIIWDNTIYSCNSGGIALRDSCYNNTLSHNTIYSIYTGIDFLSNCYHNTLSNNTISSCHYGVNMGTSHNNTLQGNNISPNQQWSNCIRVVGSQHINVINNNVSLGNENIRIDGTSNTVIHNNTITTATGAGIVIASNIARNNIISNNTLTQNNKGIALGSYSNFNIVGNNTITSSTHYGIELFQSHNNTLTKNTISNNGVYGATIWYGSNYNTVTNNTIISNNNRGINLYQSNYNTLTNNTLTSNNDYGIILDGDCDYNTLNNNTINHTTLYEGLYIKTGSNNNTVQNNTISHNNRDGIASENCNNNIFHNNIITYNNRHGIYLWSTSNYNTLTENLLINNTERGIVLGSSSHNNVKENNITLHGWAGISTFTNAHNNTIQNNTIAQNYRGLVLWESPHTNLEGNTISHNTLIGLRIGHATGDTIINNTITSNDLRGMFLTSVNHSQITGNIITSNDINGTKLETCNNNNISGNTITGHTLYGLYIFSSSHNNIFYNNHLNNTYNVCDDSNNKWNISKTSGASILGGPYLGGNYWHDYTGIDSNGDGLGETSYPVPCGSKSNTDWLPLLEPNYAPAINFTHTPPTPTTQDTITFLDTSTDSDGFIVNWTWDLGDGNSSFLQNPSHSYADNGTYTVVLTVMDDDGATNFTQKNVTVLNVPPIANFTYTPPVPTTFDILTFTDTSIDTDGDVVAWYWEFGDGSTQSLQNPIHTYPLEGTYQVNLTVWDDDGATNTITQFITVIKPPIDYILISHYSHQEAWDCNVSTNFTLTLYSAAFNNTYGFIEFCNATWSIINYSSTAHINTIFSTSVDLFTGWTNGMCMLTATDGEGHNDTLELAINQSLSSLMLHQGWNMITIPYINPWTAETLGENITGCTIVIWFNTSSQSFLTHVVGVPWDNFPIEDGVGYFLYVTSDSVFSMSDFPIGGAAVTIYTSWNLIGWYPENPSTAESLGQNISGCTLVLMFDAEIQTFLTHVVGTPWDNFAIERGMGLFIYATVASIWQGEG